MTIARWPSATGAKNQHIDVLQVDLTFFSSDTFLQPFTKQSRVYMILEKRSFKNIVRKFL